MCTRIGSEAFGVVVARARVCCRVPLLVLLGLVVQAGCQRDRVSMRPVYVAPGSETTAPELVVPEGGSETTEMPRATTPPAPTKTPPPSSSDEPPLNPDGLKATPSERPATDKERVPEAPVGFNAPAKGRSRRAASIDEALLASVDDPADLLQPPQADRRWKYIVLHHSASESGSYATLDKKHREDLGWTGCGYHFVIGNGSESPDGRVEVARRWSDQKQGAHCRDGKYADINEYGIGICLIGDFDKSAPSDKQIASARELVRYLRERYAIPADRVGVHSAMAAGRAECPGKLFPRKEIIGTSRMAALAERRVWER